MNASLLHVSSASNLVRFDDDGGCVDIVDIDNDGEHVDVIVDAMITFGIWIGVAIAVVAMSLLPALSNWRTLLVAAVSLPFADAFNLITIW